MKHLKTWIVAAALFLLIATAPPVKWPTSQGDTIAAAIAAWGPDWLWGLAAIDYNSDGLDDLCVTDHNGDSMILENVGDGTWNVAAVENALGGTFRPVVFDFDSDGSPDLLYRDSAPKTAFHNSGTGVFTSVAFAYGTGNDPVRYTGNGWFAHDFGKWEWDGNTFKAVNWTNPNFAKLPKALQDQITEDYPKQFYQPRFDGCAAWVSFSGAWYYEKKTESYCRFFWDRRGKLIDVTAKLGLPSSGVVVYVQPGFGDYVLISGAGLYTKSLNWNTYAKSPGALTDFLATWNDWHFEVQECGPWLVVSNIRGRSTRVYEIGTWKEIASVGSWDGEAFAVGDYNGDGKPDAAIGSGGTVVFVWGE